MAQTQKELAQTISDQPDNSLWFDPGQRMSAKVSADTHRLNIIKKTFTKQNQSKPTAATCFVTATICAQEEKKPHTFPWTVAFYVKAVLGLRVL